MALENSFRIFEENDNAHEQPEEWGMACSFKIGELVKLKQKPKFNMSEVDTEPSLHPYFKKGETYRILLHA